MLLDNVQVEEHPEEVIPRFTASYSSALSRIGKSIHLGFGGSSPVSLQTSW
jgi:hypothetical protein